MREGNNGGYANTWLLADTKTNEIGKLELGLKNVIFYRSGPIDTLKQPAEVISNKSGSGDQYVIMSQKTWSKISDAYPSLPPPLLKSEGNGPEGDAPLVLFKGRSSSNLAEQSSKNVLP